ncbi:MAG: ribosome rescue protein RqcH [Desulfurococcaceae archaeon]
MLKKAMDIIDIYAWVTAYSSQLRDCFVENAYRYKYAWLLKLRCKSGARLLKVEPGQRLHFSRTEPLSKEVDKLAQYLRAHVRGGRIVEASMPWWERVVLIETTKSGKKLRHYIEIVPRGLWVVADTENKILYASRFEEFRDRVVRIGATYAPPPARGVKPVETEALITALLSGRDLVRGIVAGWGLPGYVAEEVLLRAGLYELKNAKPDTIQQSGLEALVEAYRELLREAAAGRGFLVYGGSGLELYTPYRPRLFSEVYEWEVREASSLEEAIDVYFSELEAFLEEQERIREAEKRREAWRKRVEEQEKAVAEYRQKLEELSKRLSIIYENYAVLEEKIECARRVRAERGWQAVGSFCGIDSYDEKKGLLVVRVGETDLVFSIRADFKTQVIELERERGDVEKKLRKALEVLEELKAKSAEVEREASTRTYAKPAPRFWYEKFRWSITRNGLLVIAGRDAPQNELLVKKYLRDDDLFFHADVHGAPATILLRHGGKYSEEDLWDAAVIAACYSRAWKAGVGYVEVYWVYGKQVSKTPPSGEYLARGAFMIYGERSYIKVPLRLGIGLRYFCDEVYGGYVKVYVGSPEAVKQSSLSYAVVAPGDTKPEDAAEELAKLLAEHAFSKTGVHYVVAPQSLYGLLPGSLKILEHGPGLGADRCEQE